MSIRRGMAYFLCMCDEDVRMILLKDIFPLAKKPDDIYTAERLDYAQMDIAPLQKIH